VRTGVTLTVAEGKRLIGRAVARMPAVRAKMRKGMIVIAKGTTNAYVVEELLGKRIDLMAYASGVLKPARPDADPHRARRRTLPDIVLQDGKPRRDLDRFNAVEHFKPGDVYIKGANALDYPNRKAGILIGDPQGGTIGKVMGHLVGKRGHLVLPVGLEKRVFGDLDGLHRALQDAASDTWRLQPVTGTIVTEIEALRSLAGVEAALAAAGGVAGAEGCVALLLAGSRAAVAKARRLLRSVQGEPRTLERAVR